MLHVMEKHTCQVHSINVEQQDHISSILLIFARVLRKVGTRYHKYFSQNFFFFFCSEILSYLVFTSHKYCIGAHVIPHVIIRSQVVDVSNTQYRSWWHMALSKHTISKFTQQKIADHISNDSSVSRERIISIHQNIFRDVQRFVKALGLKFSVLMFDESLQT